MVEIGQIIKAHFQRKRRANPRLSLRGFAKKLEVSPSYLSAIMSGKRLPPVRILQPLAKALDIDQETQDRLLLLVMTNKNQVGDEAQLAFANTSATKPKRSEKQWHQIDHHQMGALKSWHYFAILQTLQLKDCDGSLHWVAGYLKLEKKQTQDLLNELVSLGLLEFHQEHNAYTPLHRFNEYRSRDKKFLSLYHQSALGKISQILKTQSEESDLKKRLVIGGAITVRKRDVAVVKQKISDFLKELMEFCDSESPEEVYQITVGFCPLGERPKSSTSSLR